MKKYFPRLLTAILCGMSLSALADAGEVSQALTGYYNTIVTVCNIIFGILMVIGVVKVVSSFIGGGANSVRNLIYLVVAAIIWFGFNLIVSDVMATSGGSTGGYTLPG